MKKALLKTILLSFLVVCTSTLSTFAIGWVHDGGGNWSYVDAEGFYAKSTIKSSGSDRFYLDEYGNMVRDYLLEDYDDNIYYFDDTGKMVTNTWVAVDPLQVYNPMDNPPTIYLYYFGANGRAFKAQNGGMVKKTIDGKKYFFNENGQMLSGWINEQGETFDLYNSEEDPFVGYCYYAGDETDGVLREGWHAYEEGSVEDKYYLKQTLWFYFLAGSNKKVQANDDSRFYKKIINGYTYAFDDNGVMVVGWDSDTLDVNNTMGTLVTTKKYYTEDEDNLGSLAKKKWVFAVPSMKQNLDDHEQEVERWFYATASGDVEKGTMRKINKDYYIFNTQGIMQTGICVVKKGTKEYVDCIDVEKTDGKDFIVSRYYISKKNEAGSSEFTLFNDSIHQLYYFSDNEDNKLTFGKREVGSRTVSFGDDDYTFKSKPSGESEKYDSKDRKYYQNGLMLRPDPALGYGLVFLGYSQRPTADRVDYPPLYTGVTLAAHPWAKEDQVHNNNLTDYIVINKDYTSYAGGVYPVFAAVQSNGTRLAKGNTVKKDKAGNYWLIGEGGYVINIYNVPIRKHVVNGVATWQFKSDKFVNNKTKSVWIDFMLPGGDPDADQKMDIYGKTCKYSRLDPGDYAVNIDNTYCVNFRLED